MRRRWVALSGLFDEIFASISARPSRSALTALGIMLGVAAFVGVLGLAATTSNQIDARFDEATAFTVTATDVGESSSAVAPVDDYSVPPGYRERVQRIDGVVAVGVVFRPPLDDLQLDRFPPGIEPAGAQGLSVAAIDRDMFAISGGTVTQGTIWDRAAETREMSVAVLGKNAARVLGIDRIDAQPAVFVNGRPYLVVGIADGFTRLPELGGSVIIPASTALQAYGPPHQPRASVIVTTRVGAAGVVGAQLGAALRPDDPSLFKISVPGSPTKLRSSVTGTLRIMLLATAGIILVIGTLGIANTILVSVLERTGEIGLRRALGARPIDIALQFLLESAALGLIGGIVGTTLAVVSVVVVALTKTWTPTLDSWTVAAGPAIGLTVGLLAGLYPAIRAIRIQPAAALRQ